jgi:acetyl-CoA carboxylase carboxyl transferase subunit alpha
MADYYLEFEKPIQEVEKSITDLKKAENKEKGIDFSIEISELERQKSYVVETIYKNLTAWQTVQVARHPQRPLFLDYVKLMFDDFMEFYGDRLFKDDTSIITGFARIGEEKFVVIGEEKGRTTKDKIYRNFGMPHPEGYRKALRAMKMAEKFGKPILTFVDTNGAYPGMDSEERGQGEAIARNLFEMSAIKVPIITTVIGEGGSGGALAIAVSDKVLMLENSIYSVITPEGCASILWKDSAKMDKSAKALKLTSRDLIGFDIIEEIIPEPMGGAHRNHADAAANIKEAIIRNYKEISKIPVLRLVDKRYDRFRKLGSYQEIQ